MSAWPVEMVRATAGSLHDLDVAWDRRLVRVNEVTATAIVLGSTQSSDVIDGGAARRRGVEVARRHSGGGVVRLSPDDQIWLDLVVPRGDPLWDDDVGRASWWLGEAWAATVDAVLFAGSAGRERPAASPRPRRTRRRAVRSSIAKVSATSCWVGSPASPRSARARSPWRV